MTVKELIYRLKDFPRDAVVCVRGRNKHAIRDAVAVKQAVDPLRVVPASQYESSDAGLVVRIVGAEG
jgi:hypothetical protein